MLDSAREVSVDDFLLKEIGREYVALEAHYASFVYVIQAGEDGPVKIGSAARPTWRVGELQVANWQELKLRASIPIKGCGYYEKLAHGIAASKCVRGEWFDLTPREAVETILAALHLKQKTPTPLKALVAEGWDQDAKPYRKHVRPVLQYDIDRRAAMRKRMGIDD